MAALMTSARGSIAVRHLGAAICLFCVSSAFADDISSSGQPSDKAEKSSNAPPAVSPSPADMQQLAVGDHWSYDLTDEISGEIKQKETATITDLSSKDVTVRTELADSPKVGITIYDTSWNIIKINSTRFSPHDGSGVQLPLKIDKSWNTEADRIDSKGIVWKKTVQSRVTGRETIKTKAGEFDSFVIDSKFLVQNTNDRTRKTEAEVRTWYSPILNHWVKRASLVRVSGHVLQNNVLELTSYGRRKT
jgi:hypothetical protein